MCTSSAPNRERSIYLAPVVPLKPVTLTWACVFQSEVLILELVTIDGLATSAIASCEVSSLTHEIFDNPMECGAFITKSFLSSAEGSEVFSSFWYYITSELE